ncbi:MAG: ABC transporter ATP-binding protein [Rhodoferax sp.]|jgi:iron(III) transport system ATP-binding protein|uniref:ABC transporter ATP-binding protein n=1 Tax=Rhodoferax sp. TaxID=50421 RepID=UPI001B5A0318|nr:ABC transporter ATP-binding protein [Rhodoferax sp.]MBP9147994.1 ABC transporter ATP-binding protein [Rhodoferax sp.]MBP9734116.1 ABC transporter ATP-binding protein [Rhodoferax sp.]
MDELTLNAVSQAYGARQIISDLSFSLARGEIGCLLGPSGCGKTTALRCIAGFEPIQSGEILIAGDRVSGTAIMLAAEKRRIGMVFQDYALFAHLTVAGNVGFGLPERQKPVAKARVEELLALVGLAQHAHKYPHQLSGGQQQRVALARALAPRPRLLLMDEPFSNLDVELRERLSIEVRDILKREATTALIVTHDQHEAFSLADRVGVMHQGRIQQWDTPYNLYHQPANRFVADFVGQGAMLSGEVLNSQQVRTELGVLDGFVPLECNEGGCAGCTRSCHVDVMLRPDDIVHDDDSSLQAEVENKAFRGAEFLYTLKLPSGQRALSLVPSHHNHAIGEKIGIKLSADHVVAFRRE